MENEKIILVTRKTRLEGLIERYNTREQVRFYLERSDAQRGEQGSSSFELYTREHDVYYEALQRLQGGLAKLGRLHVIERAYLPNYLFGEKDMVVTIGVDGLVVNTAKYLDGQPLVAVNPDPAHIDGVLLPFRVEQAPEIIKRLLNGEAQTQQISMAQARLQDGQSLLAFNDLFVGARSHISARYQIQIQERQEQHSSSGVIVSTGVGATGWLSSLINMANGMWAGFGGREARLEQPRLDWQAERLIFVVREPFASKTSKADIVCGEITPQTPLVLKSQMEAGGVIFSDGIEADYLAFNAGAIVTIGSAYKKTRLVIG
jgi:NAD kinase